jgi:hypothetical protein
MQPERIKDHLHPRRNTGKIKLLSETEPEFFKRSEPNIKPSSARTETGTERKPVKPGTPPKALKAIYSHGEPESLGEYHSRKTSHIKSP